MVSDWSKKLFKRLQCKDYARFDWRLDEEGNPRLIEANPNCGWCWDGHLAKTANLAGISYSEMIQAIIKSAFERYEKVDKVDISNCDNFMYFVTRVARNKHS